MTSIENTNHRVKTTDSFDGVKRSAETYNYSPLANRGLEAASHVDAPSLSNRIKTGQIRHKLVCLFTNRRSWLTYLVTIAHTFN